MMDFICVTNADRSIYCCMEMILVFESKLEDSVSLSLLGLNKNGTPLQSNTAFGGIGNVMNILDIRMPSVKAEPEWVDIYCNNCHQQQIKAYMNKKGQVIYMESVGNNKYKPQRSPTSNMLSSMNLNIGCNNLVFKHRSTGSNLLCDIWLYDSEDAIAVIDIDGTVTKSDVRGYVETVYFKHYSHVHSGIASFLTSIDNQGIKIIFLTSRPTAHYTETRNLLSGIKQDIYAIPRGPIMMNTEKIFSAVYRELIARKTVEFKSGILLTIASLFKAAGRVSKQEPFMMGIGNKATDADAYLLAGIPNSSILIIDPNSKIIVWQDFQDKSFNSYDDMNISQFLRDTIQSFNDLHI